MKKLFFSVLLAIVSAASFSQQKPKASAEPTPLKLSTFLGRHPGGNISSDIMKMLAHSALIVRDAKGNRYTVKSFTINYTFTSTFQDEETQQTKTFRDFRSFDFYDTDKLSENWRESIKDNAKKDDVMLINKIIVRGKNGKSYLAPDIKFNILL